MEDSGTTARDPVCGMTVNAAAPKGGTHEHAGHTYAFCGPRCREKFAADPERYLQPQPAAPAATAAGTEYTCPMHPEIVRPAPGSCPICGMALEPRTATLDDDNPELRDMTRRLVVGAALTAPLVIASMAEMAGAPISAQVSAGALTWIQLALATP